MIRSPQVGTISITCSILTKPQQPFLTTYLYGPLPPPVHITHQVTSSSKSGIFPILANSATMCKGAKHVHVHQKEGYNCTHIVYEIDWCEAEKERVRDIVFWIYSNTRRELPNGQIGMPAQYTLDPNHTLKTQPVCRILNANNILGGDTIISGPCDFCHTRNSRDTGFLIEYGVDTVAEAWNRMNKNPWPLTPDFPTTMDIVTGRASFCMSGYNGVTPWLPGQPPWQTYFIQPQNLYLGS